MVRALKVGRSTDAGVERMLLELQRASNNVTLRAGDKDLENDGLPKNDVAPVQAEGRYVRFTSKGPGLTIEVRHSLGRVPRGFLEVAKSYPSTLVGWPNDPTVNPSWTKEKVFFQTEAPAGSKYIALLL